MPDFIECPYCLTTGAKQHKRNKCTACHVLHQNEYAEGVRRRDRQNRADGKSGADLVAMKGFSQLSQDRLSRKL